MQRFTELEVWRRSHRFVLEIYKITTGFPKEEKYGLTTETRRSARSVPSNIAEGAKRSSPKQYAQFINYAEASMSEVCYQLLLARDLEYLSRRKAVELWAEAGKISRMLNGLRLRVLEQTC